MAKKKKNLKDLRSVKTFKQNIQRTYNFFQSLASNIYATETVVKMFKMKKSPDYKKFEHLLEFSKKRWSYLYELGFIALFSNFESFV